MGAVYFTKDHDWIAVDGGVATVGITDYAQSQLGDILFVDLPAVGTSLKRGGEAALVESLKAASDIYSPLSGLVTESNDALEKQPSLVNLFPESRGWFFRVAFDDPAELAGLLSEDQYRQRVKRL